MCNTSSQCSHLNVTRARDYHNLIYMDVSYLDESSALLVSLDRERSLRLRNWEMFEGPRQVVRNSHAFCVNPIKDSSNVLVNLNSRSEIFLTSCTRLSWAQIDNKFEDKNEEKGESPVTVLSRSRIFRYQFLFNRLLLRI